LRFPLQGEATSGTPRQMHRRGQSGMISVSSEGGRDEIALAITTAFNWGGTNKSIESRRKGCFSKDVFSQAFQFASVASDLSEHPYRSLFDVVSGMFTSSDVLDAFARPAGQPLPELEPPR